jgi:hypothetical protein
MGVSMKWYIELPRGAYKTFNQLVLVFLNHFQLSVRYDVGIELLSTFRQDRATHISDHIQEWHRWKRLIKAYIPPKFLLEWFLKSLLPYISKDVSTSGVTSEEEAIFKSQQLDIIYAQSGMLYEILPDAPRSSYKHKADSIKNNNHTQHSFTSMRHRFFKRKPNQGKNLIFLRCSASFNFVTSHLL